MISQSSTPTLAGIAPPPFELPEPVVAPVHPVEQLLDKITARTGEFSRQDPARAVAIALGTGIFLNVIPTRFIVKTVTAVTVTVLRPALLTLGIIKALELCTEKHQHTDPS
ncbi:hypothetical protein DES53_10276 [Roseimicrobium gellanilyticum]|uniref:Uncharacterized protein n=1 Tax=Roseimicrobium gellanilyticum TaxID=748857 RepID=A0A366HRZ1_9BACT|nr:hypothetical protein [Roseimicrobium gellanilyticum]RBP45694.1 hypothetical protein DES53_10276 [Roseimicrobium gellanilyticum]